MVFAVCIFACSILPKRSPEKFMIAAKKYENKKQYEKAYKHYSRAINLNPLLYEAYLGRANVWIAIDSVEKAIDDMNMYVNSNPERTKLAKAYMARAELMWRAAYRVEACDDWVAACELNISDTPCKKYRLKCK